MNAHTLDPVTSHEAAAFMEDTGTLASHKATVALYVKRHPGLTASEYSRLTGMDVVEVRRRLTNLKDEGWAYQEGARRAAGQKVREMQWFPVEAQGVLL